MTLLLLLENYLSILILFNGGLGFHKFLALVTRLHLLNVVECFLGEGPSLSLRHDLLEKRPSPLLVRQAGREELGIALYHCPNLGKLAELVRTLVKFLRIEIVSHLDHLHVRLQAFRLGGGLHVEPLFACVFDDGLLLLLFGLCLCCDCGFQKVLVGHISLNVVLVAVNQQFVLVHS